MRKRRLLLAASALSTAIGCGGKDKPRIYANPKGPHYVDIHDAPPPDAPPPDAPPEAKEEKEEKKEETP